jgi:hypothetical protein
MTKTKRVNRLAVKLVLLTGQHKKKFLTGQHKKGEIKINKKEERLNC